ncbi:MerR family transcriptional regulator [Marinobacterium marinum]|uniref:MerR family transcriptional regulator n=1 Tax=Marinobacterium marinum TaxID=2756129 RepID=A0A7W1WZK0_9GAMM|nr:MerR family transcriptional regulator [Marinobacterium marinum]MBA4503001.1 MerR family transcriptional regulator [Marinobacterium marinum]
MPETSQTASELGPIPPKRYFTIGEVADLCRLKPHVLRYWEQEFAQIQPVKRNSRRYYQQQDVLLLRQIRSLLHEQGYTIAGARQWLAGEGGSDDTARYRQLLRQTIGELEEIQSLLKSVSLR